MTYRCDDCGTPLWGGQLMEMDADGITCGAYHDAARCIAALKDKARRFKGWRIRWSQGDGGEAFTVLTALCNVRHTARGMRRNPKKYRNVRIVRVYRKRREAGEGRSDG